LHITRLLASINFSPFFLFLHSAAATPFHPLTTEIIITLFALPFFLLHSSNSPFCHSF
jgi:hypothetical protein